MINNIKTNSLTNYKRPNNFESTDEFSFEDYKQNQYDDQIIAEGCKKQNSNTFDYINDLEELESPLIEVVFKGNRRINFKNVEKLILTYEELVIVESDNGIDAGHITNPSAKPKKSNDRRGKYEVPRLKLVRIATDKDWEQYKANKNEEQGVETICRELIAHFKLDMKVTEAEWQFDRQRLTIYFTAPQRVDFRELVKELARRFRTRIELRQISTREQTKRMGCGIGPCGKDLCCTSFLKDFCHITLDHAKVQQLSNNISKLSGNCGRLKCCLTYEFDTYVEAFEKYPPLDSMVHTPDGIGKISKVDIFKDKVSLQIQGFGWKTISFEELDEYVNAGRVFPEDKYHEYKAKFKEFEIQDAEEKKAKEAEMREMRKQEEEERRQEMEDLAKKNKERIQEHERKSNNRNNQKRRPQKNFKKPNNGPQNKGNRKPNNKNASPKSPNPKNGNPKNGNPKMKNGNGKANNSGKPRPNNNNKRRVNKPQEN